MNYTGKKYMLQQMAKTGHSGFGNKMNQNGIKPPNI